MQDMKLCYINGIQLFVLLNIQHEIKPATCMQQGRVKFYDDAQFCLAGMFICVHRTRRLHFEMNVNCVSAIMWLSVYM